MPQVAARLLIAGDGPMRSAWGALAAELNVTDRVQFLGDISDGDLPRLYAAADLFVLPSNVRAEAFGLVLLEAMAAGLPVVTTTEVNAGLRATPGEHLLLAEDDDALVAVTTTLLGDAAERSRLGQAGRAFVRENFRWEAVGERLREIEARLQA